MGASALLIRGPLDVQADLTVGPFSLSEMHEIDLLPYLNAIGTSHVLVAGNKSKWEGYDSMPVLIDALRGATIQDMKTIADRYYLLR